MSTPGTPVVKAPKKADNVNVRYRRPAGAFTSFLTVENGSLGGILYAPYLAVKPYADYTFLGIAEGVSDNAEYFWEVQHWIENGPYDEQVWTTVDGKDLTWRWRYETDEVPTFCVIDNDEYYSWSLHGYEMTSSHPAVYEEHKAHLISVPGSIEELWGFELLKSSKTFGYNRNQNQFTLMTVLSGADPYGQNEKGWWFGKNAGKGNCRFDGIAQAFEKPEHPYLLKQVIMDCAVLQVTGPVDMYCKIYKIDEIPAYMDSGYVTLPEEPGELIARGRASLTPLTDETTDGLVFFTLYDEEDGLDFEITKTIDCAILVVVEGYNDPEMENLKDFSAMIASNIDEDEGFGELAYFKVGHNDEEGNLDHYEWTGLNNYFSNHTMKTGFTIFLSTEMPYLTFNYFDEDGEYIFPDEGGLIEIEFWSWYPSADDEWTVTCNGDEIPEWLSIELTDRMLDGEFTGIVNAEVVAEPLPEGVKYREAIVRFEVPGAYIDYKFIQGTKIGPNPPPHDFDSFDINGDGEITVADVDALIYYLQSYDDYPIIILVNELIDAILSGQ